MSQATGRTKSHLYERFAAALLEENEIGKAAAKVGINRRTAARWLHDPQFSEFRRIYQRMKGQVLESALLVGLRHAEAAMRVLIDVMTGPPVPNCVSKVTAASFVLETLMRSEKLDKIAESLHQLEIDRSHGYVIPVAESPFDSEPDAKDDSGVVQ